MAKVRDHYFEVRPDGTYIYLGSTNPEAISRRDEADMFFANGIDNPVCVIRGAMATIQPPQPSGHFEDLGGPEPIKTETCLDCGHAVSMHTDGGHSGYTCQSPQCDCSTPAWYLAETPTRKNQLESIIAMLRDYMAMTEDENRQAVMDFDHSSSFTYTGKDGEQYTIGFGPNYPYDPEPTDDGPEFHAPLGDGDRDSFDYEYLDF